VSIVDYFRPKSKAALLRGERVAWIEDNARAPYIRQCVLSFPAWVDRRALKAIWEECRKFERATGERYVIDHEIPLNHPFVSGLSVPWNMRAIPYRCNATKSNKWAPDQLELLL